MKGWINRKFYCNDEWLKNGWQIDKTLLLEPFNNIIIICLKLFLKFFIKVRVRGSEVGDLESSKLLFDNSWSPMVKKKTI